MNDAALQERLRQLRIDFVRRLPEKFAAMEAAVDALQAAAGAETVHTAYRVFHSLVGSAGIFGLDDHARLAREAENLLKPVLETPEAVPADAVSRLRACLADLRNVAIPTDL